jgi:hypothetical protein
MGGWSREPGYLRVGGESNPTAPRARSKMQDGLAFVGLLFRGRLFRVTDCGGGGPIEQGGSTPRSRRFVLETSRLADPHFDSSLLGPMFGGAEEGKESVLGTKRSEERALYTSLWRTVLR